MYEVASQQIHASKVVWIAISSRLGHGHHWSFDRRLFD